MYPRRAGAAAEYPAAGNELEPQLREVIDLAVVRYHRRVRAKRHWLRARGRQVEDAQAAMAERDGCVREGAAAVRAAMGDGGHHASNDRPARGCWTAELNETDDCAHRCYA